MPEAAKKKTLFDLCGGHPALDLVNSLDNRFRGDGPNEMLGTYGDLLRFLQESSLLSVHGARVLAKAATTNAAGQTLAATRDLREVTAAVLYGNLEGRSPTTQQTKLLERYFLDSTQHRELRWKIATEDPLDHPGLTWQRGRFETDPNLPVWVLAQAVSEVLLTHEMERVRTCGVDTCRWLFLDTSKNHTRRWCNMKVCGNRMKAQRFLARQAQ
jgi:predicted RNA-binding Zn ribbon-like protein